MKLRGVFYNLVPKAVLITKILMQACNSRAWLLKVTLSWLKVLKSLRPFFSETGMTLNMKADSARVRGQSGHPEASPLITGLFSGPPKRRSRRTEDPSSGDPKRSRGSTTPDSIMRGFSILASSNWFCCVLPISGLFLEKIVVG